VAACPDPVVAKTIKQAEVLYARMYNSTRSLAAEEVAAYISSRDR